MSESKSMLSYHVASYCCSLGTSKRTNVGLRSLAVAQAVRSIAVGAAHNLADPAGRVARGAPLCYTGCHSASQSDEPAVRRQ